MIKLSRLADYGIVILVEMARVARRPVAASDIATATRVPHPTTSKILKSLMRSGIVVSHRGVSGGYSLARPPEEISVAQVIESLDGPIALTACVEPTSVDCEISQCCPARTNWERINTAIRGTLDAITVAEMASTIPRAFMVDGPERAAPADQRSASTDERAATADKRSVVELVR